MDIKTNHTTKYKLLFNNLGTELETQKKINTDFSTTAIC